MTQLGGKAHGVPADTACDALQLASARLGAVATDSQCLYAAVCYASTCVTCTSAVVGGLIAILSDSADQQIVCNGSVGTRADSTVHLLLTNSYDSVAPCPAWREQCCKAQGIALPVDSLEQAPTHPKCYILRTEACCYHCIQYLADCDDVYAITLNDSCPSDHLVAFAVDVRGKHLVKCFQALAM